MRYSFYESVQDSAGNVLNAANVSIYLTGTATPAKIYDSDGNLQSTIPQLQTDSKGYFWFEVDDTDYDSTQRFDVKITKSSYTDLLIKKIDIIGASGATGSGDMTKAVYDTDNNGIVDKAETVDDGTNSSTAAEVADAVAKKHSQQHSITSSADHTSTATPNQILKADANGLPINATNTDTEVSGAVTKANSALQNVVEDTTPQLGGNLEANNHAILKNVTTKTTTATLTVAEAGTVFVSASSDYTITLPTAVGYAGLTYKFKKTDANYNLITLDGNGTETFNYENSTDAPAQTYPRLNTYGAEVTIISDGSNWQVMDENLGQVPKCKAYLSANQTNVAQTTDILVNLDTEVYDIGSNFDTTSHRFTAPISGIYFIKGFIAWNRTNIQANKLYAVIVYKNGANICWWNYQTAVTEAIASPAPFMTHLDKDDYIELKCYHTATVDTIVLTGDGEANTNLGVTLLSKD